MQTTQPNKNNAALDPQREADGRLDARATFVYRVLDGAR